MKNKSTKNKYYLILIPCLITLVLIILISWLNRTHQFQYNKILNNIEFLLQMAAYISGSVSFISMIITVNQYFNDKQTQMSHKRAVKLTRSINIIKAFKTRILSSMDASEQNVKDKRGITQTKNNLMAKALTFKDLKRLGLTFKDLRGVTFGDLTKPSKKEIYKFNRFNNVIGTINDLEQWSLYISNDLVYYKLVYRETHYDYINFINEFHDVLDDATSSDDKYQACHDVYDKMKKDGDFNGKVKRTPKKITK